VNLNVVSFVENVYVVWFFEDDGTHYDVSDLWTLW